MRALIKWKFLLFVILLAYQFAWGVELQSKRKAEVLNIESGLSQSWVTALVVDRYGFLWVGTQDGLNRYDGYSFKKYRNNPLDSTTLCNNNINSICEDAEGNIWIGTWRGLSFLNRSTGEFTNYFHDLNNAKSLSHNRVYNVYVDKKGVVWVKTLESLDRFNPSTQTFDRFPHFSSPFTNAAYADSYGIFEDSQSRLWVGSKDGLFLFDRSLGLYKRFSYDLNDSKSLSNNNVRAIAEDEQGSIWVATERGLNRLISIDKGFKRFYAKPGDSKSLQSSDIQSLFVDKRGALWVGTSEGVCVYMPGKGFEIVSNSADNPSVLNVNITSIAEDKSSVIWMGTLSGLVKWDVKDQKFSLFSKDRNGNNLFGNNMIGSVYNDVSGYLWVGTWNAGLYRFNRRDNSIVKYSSKQPNPYKIPNDYVHVISRLPNGDLVIGTRNGVQLFDERSGTFVDFFKAKGIEASTLFQNNRVYSMLNDTFGNLWFGTRMGLFKYNGAVLEQFGHNPADSTTLTANEVYSLVQRGEDIWVGTYSGLNRLTISTGKVKRYQASSTYTYGQLISNDIISLLVDSDETLWVGTSSGLHVFDSEEEQFKLITEEDGLPNNIIYAILEDDNGLVWVSTNWGIASVNPSDHSVVTYGVSDGLQSYEFNLGASCKSEDGELFFGGISGLNAFYPDSIGKSYSTPAISFTQLEVVGPNKKVVTPIEATNEIAVKHPFSMISIEFAVLDFTHPERNRYMYKLDGFDDSWIAIGNKRSAVFSSIPEGEYTLRVKGANSDGIWNEEGTSIRLIVRTQWWRTKLANIIYGVLLVLFIFVFLRARTRILRRTNRLLRERELTMKEMEVQREELLLKNKSITDSINYAKRIQEALIPSEHHFKKILPESFILYMPKDIVSGDFYWINETKNRIFVAAIDCTGHGVPGAFMSIIGVELLRNIINVMGINDPAEILNLLDQGIRDTFSKSVNDMAPNVKDGMDVSFCVIDKENRTLQFAGAFSNLYLIRENNLKEIKGQRYTVGFSYETEKPQFFSHTESLEPDDMIYMFTDGYADQFGGPEGKKYKFRRFRHLLLNVHKYTLDVQRKLLIGSINEWKGDMEQVDDILIIGIKPEVE